MKHTVQERTNIDRVIEINEFGEGLDQHPTHHIEVRVWRTSITLTVHAQGGGWCSCPLSKEAAMDLSDALKRIAQGS